MKKNNKKGFNRGKFLEIFLISAVTVLILGVFTLGLSFRSGAFGDYNDYDYDSGGSDWGGSDWGSSSDWDSGSDWGGSSGGDVGGLFDLIWLIFSFVPARFRCCCIVLVIIAFIIFSIIKRKSNRNNVKKYVEF